MHILIYANCQGLGFKVLLEQLFALENRTLTVTHIENYRHLDDASFQVPETLLQSADVFLYQPLADRYGHLSTASLLGRLRPGCQALSFPYVYNDALWPLIVDEGSYTAIDILERLLQQELSLREVLSRFDAGYIDFEFARRYARTMGILREREAGCDLKVADFIDAHLKHHKLFLTQNHPTTCVFVHLTNQLLRRIAHPNRIDKMFDLDTNLARLPGPFPQSSYDAAHYRFSYRTEINDGYFRRHLANIYGHMLGAAG